MKDHRKIMSSDPFDTLRELAGEPVPADVDTEYVWARLQVAIERETTRSRRRWLAPVAVAAAIAVAAAAVLLTSRPSPAEAAVGEIAQAARQTTPEEIPDGSFVYTRTDQVALNTSEQGDLLGLPGAIAYLLPSTQQTWRQGDFEQSTTTVGTPIFFDPEAEVSYYAHDWDKADRVGETFTEQFTGITNELSDINWPANPRELRNALDDYLRQGTINHSMDIETIELAMNVLHLTNPSPELRAAILDVIGQLPVQLINQSPDGSITLAISYDHPALIEETFTLNPAGYLIAQRQTYLEPAAELGIPAGTTVWDATYTVPTIVDSLDTPDQ
jgi:hypothetical protein